MRSFDRVLIIVRYRLKCNPVQARMLFSRGGYRSTATDRAQRRTAGEKSEDSSEVEGKGIVGNPLVRQHALPKD